MKLFRFGIAAFAAIGLLALYGCGSGYVSEWPTELERQAGCQPGEVVNVSFTGALQGSDTVSAGKSYVVEDGELVIDAGAICSSYAAAAITPMVEDVDVRGLTSLGEEVSLVDAELITISPNCEGAPNCLTASYDAGTYSLQGSLICNEIAQFASDIDLVALDIQFDIAATDQATLGLLDPEWFATGTYVNSFVIKQYATSCDGGDDDFCLTMETPIARQDLGTNTTVNFAEDWDGDLAEFKSLMAASNMDYYLTVGGYAWDVLIPGAVSADDVRAFALVQSFTWLDDMFAVPTDADISVKSTMTAKLNILNMLSGYDIDAFAHIAVKSGVQDQLALDMFDGFMDADFPPPAPI